MVLVEPVPGEPAALTTLEGGERALLIADYHAGYETALRYERGVEVPSRGPARRERLLALVESTGVDSILVLGDLMHSIGEPGGAERGELEVLFESLEGVSITLAKGNHDGAIETWLVDAAGGSLEVTPGEGVAIAELGICHGHTWPSPAVLACETICVGHEHPCVRLEDEVGGARVEQAWLRGSLDPTPFLERPTYEGVSWLEAGPRPEVIVVPAFNDLVGGTWVNEATQSFLAPFFPEGLAEAVVYLLDGTRLGPYQSV